MFTLWHNYILQFCLQKQCTASFKSFICIKQHTQFILKHFGTFKINVFLIGLQYYLTFKHTC